jgi:cytochrome b involved in lipid metabolism
MARPSTALTHAPGKLIRTLERDAHKYHFPGSASIQNKDILNDVYAGVNQTTFEVIKLMRVPNRLELDACRLLALFMNIFRETD